MRVDLGAIRTKTRSRPTKTQAAFNDTRYKPNGTVDSTVARASFTYASGSESITYTTKSRAERSRSNMCIHIKELFNQGGFSVVADAPVEKPPVGSAGYYWDYRNHQKIACEGKSAVIAAAQAALNIDSSHTYVNINAQALINDAWSKLQPDLSELSVPNFILDVEDIRNLVKLWRKSASLVRNLAGLHLNYKYGWKPTWSDVQSCIDAVTNLRSRLREFEESVGRNIQKSRVMEDSSLSKTGTIVSGGSTTYWTARWHRRVEAFITYAPQPLAVTGGIDKILRGFLDALGFELDPRIIWDAIPFSFVFDWFISIGDFLHRYRIDTLELPVMLVDSCLQAKGELRCDWYWMRYPSDDLFYNPPKSAGCDNVSSYFKRMPIFPDFASLATMGWKQPSINQAVTAVALATVLGSK